MKLSKPSLILLALLVLAGCSAPPHYRVLWPPPPGESMVEYIGVYYSQNSFEKTGFERFKEGLLGPEPARSLRRPGGIAADGLGRVYVSDNLLRNVQIYDFNTRTVRMLTPQAQMTYPLGLDLDSAGRLYVADGQAQKVLVFDTATGALLQSIGDRTFFANPAYVRVNERLGRIYVADGKNNRIVVFALDGSHLFTFGVTGDKPGQLFGPQGLAIATDNRVFVPCQYTGRVEVFDADGQHLESFGVRGDGKGQMEMPKALAFDSRGQLYIADAKKGSVTITDQHGAPLLFLGGGKARWQVTTFGLPNGIFIDGNDRIYVSDAQNQRFAVWQLLTEAYLREHPVTEADLRALQHLVVKPPAVGTAK